MAVLVDPVPEREGPGVGGLGARTQEGRLSMLPSMGRCKGTVSLVGTRKLCLKRHLETMRIKHHPSKPKLCSITPVLLVRDWKTAVHRKRPHDAKPRTVKSADPGRSGSSDRSITLLILPGDGITVRVKAPPPRGHSSDLNSIAPTPRLSFVFGAPFKFKKKEGREDQKNKKEGDPGRFRR